MIIQFLFFHKCFEFNSEYSIDANDIFKPSKYRLSGNDNCYVSRLPKNLFHLKQSSLLINKLDFSKLKNYKT